MRLVLGLNLTRIEQIPSGIAAINAETIAGRRREVVRAGVMDVTMLLNLVRLTASQPTRSAPEP